jgi:hypothetical protein
VAGRISQENTSPGYPPLKLISATFGLGSLLLGLMLTVLILWSLLFA